QPRKDDIFRTYPDKGAGWWPVRILEIDRGMGSNSNHKKTYLIGRDALANPVVAERARHGYAILVVTAEAHPAGWMIRVPDEAEYESTYKFDRLKWDCAERGMTEWVNLAWKQKERAHEWRVIDLSGQANEQPVWPGEHPLVLIDRAIESQTINDPK